MLRLWNNVVVVCVSVVYSVDGIPQSKCGDWKMCDAFVSIDPLGGLVVDALESELFASSY